MHMQVTEQLAPATSAATAMARALDDWPAGQWRSVLTHTHTYSGRDDHGGPTPPPESYRQLARWAQRCGVDAVGMGSPYTPKAAASYEQFDGARGRDAYYDERFDKLAVLDADEIERMLAEVNDLSAGRTLFYLDNETPKGRYGHMWWLGYHPDLPAWHDYDQPFDQWMVHQSDPDDCSTDEPLPYERRPYLQILAAQRARGALGMWAHPTSWWRGERNRFITNIATEMPAHAIAEGGLDGLVIMGYHPYRPQYQSLWFELLDRGYRVPGVAEMDCGLSDPNTWAHDRPMLTWVRTGDGAPPLSLRRLVDGMRRGAAFVSSGPLVDLQVDGQGIGQVARTSRGQSHRVRITALPAPGDEVVGRVELIGRGGQVLWSQERFAGGSTEILIAGLAHRGYLIVRAFGEEDVRLGRSWREVRQIAVSNPVYLHPAGKSFNRPASTEVTVTIAAASPYAGGEVRFEAMDGTLLATAGLARGTIRQAMPASGRITLVSTDGRSRTDYLVNANPALQQAQRYLYRGRFLLDFPSLQPGELPPEAWRIDRYAEAMREIRLTY